MTRQPQDSLEIADVADLELICDLGGGPWKQKLSPWRLMEGAAARNCPPVPFPVVRIGNKFYRDCRADEAV